MARQEKNAGLQILIFVIMGSVLVLCSYPAYSLWKNAPQKEVLENGLPLIYQRDESSAITVVQLFIKGGKRAESAGKEGLAYLTTRLALEIPDQDKVQDLMRVSSQISMAAKGDYSLIRVECLSTNLDETLKIFTQIILDPLFSGLRINMIKKHMNHLAKIEEDEPGNVGRQACLAAFFGSGAYGTSVYGREESLKAIKGRDISEFYKKFFTAENMILSVASDLKEEDLLKILRKYFLKFPRGKSAELSPVSSTVPQEKKIVLTKDTKQSFVSRAFSLPEISPKNLALAYLLENILGKGPGSKLWPLRTDEKLAYQVNCWVTPMEKGGILEAYLETANEKKETGRDALKRVLDDVYQNGLMEEELQAAKVMTKADFLRNNESKNIRTASFAGFEAWGLGYDFLLKIFAEIDAVSVEEMKAYIKEILNPDKAIEVVVGPSLPVTAKDAF